MTISLTDPFTSRDVMVADGTFHHLAMSRDMAAGQFRLYADGQLLTSANLNVATGGDITNGDGEADPLLIGAVVQGGSQVRQWFFKGLIDEVRLFTRSLSDAEVERLFVAEGGRPRLRMAQAALTVTLRWPACAESFFLESAAALPASSWLKVTNAVLPEGDLLSTTLPVEADPQFYRLRKGN